MKKILMSVVGIGLGHATRSEAVYRQIKEKSKVKILTYHDTYRYYKKLKIPAEDFGGYKYKGRGYSFDVLLQINDFFKNPTKLRADYKRFRNLADKFKPDIVFTDSEPNGFFYATRRDLPNFTLTNLITTLTHYKLVPKKLKTREIAIQHLLLKRLINFMLKKGDKFFVPSFERNIFYEEKIEYTDLIVRKKPAQLPSISHLKKKLKIDKDFYYVHVGGSDIERELFHMLELVLPNFKDEFFIVSSNHSTKEVIKKDNMLIFPFVKNALEYVKLSKGIISPAGHSSISEALVYKKPILVIPLRNHIEQLVNGALIKKEGLGETCFFERKLSISTLIDSLKRFISKYDILTSNVKATKFKGDGAKQIAREILKQK
ncbi:MAG: hypothetical protein J7K73_02720 [Nanoarchaeota archaeon]|nr:hypothetical protein [Nanoarchaeota archaeon]